MVVAIVAASLSINASLAASITGMSDTMTNQTASAFSDHVIKFTTPTGAADASDTIIVTFPSDFDFTGADDTFVTLSHGATTGLETAEVLAAAPSASDWGLVFSGGSSLVMTFTAPSDGTGAAVIAPNDKIVITLTNTTDVFKNATSSGSYPITIAGTFGDTGSFAVPIITNGTVDITATVDPTITFAIRTADDTGTTSTCSLGTLTTGSVATCAYRLAVDTNASAGYTIYAKANGGLLSGSDEIDAIAEDGTVSTGVEGYGIAVTGATTGGAAGATYTEEGVFNDDDTPLPTVTTSLFNIDKPADYTPLTLTDSTLVTHRAAISAITPAGSYTQTVTYTVTGSF